MPSSSFPSTMVGGKGPRQRIWEAIRAQGDDPWDRQKIAEAAGVNFEAAKAYVISLNAAGIVQPAEPRQLFAGRPRAHFVLIRNVGAEAPRLRRDGTETKGGAVQAQIWRTLRTLRQEMTPREIAAYASTTSCPVTEGTVIGYLLTLLQAGYLRRQEAPRGHRYALLATRNTGPRPPVICVQRVVYDQNEGCIVWQPEVTPEDAV
ncbi:MAG: hypothetical protein JWL63_3245 [Rhodocyclales bacterium]|nr:hypothetical protein [Rhodocyclales bacterium]